MEWGNQQVAALSAFRKWFANPSTPVFRMFGWAGTGKTTLARHLAEGARHVVFGAFTGKAALVLRKKGCEGASTIHSMIYNPAPASESHIKEMRKDLQDLRQVLHNKEGLDEAKINAHRRVLFLQEQIEQATKAANVPRFRLNTASEVRNASLIIIDEVTMVDQQMGEDLLSFGVPVLVLGDPGQLPPIGGGGFFTKQSPDILLTDVHRQAKDNPITRLASMARAHQSIPLGKYGDTEVIPKAELKDRSQDVVDSQILLLGKNKTRLWANQRLRQLKGMTSPYPVAGDQLVCLRNNHDRGLLNGGLWNVLHTEDTSSNDSRRYLKVVSQDEPRTEEVEVLSEIFKGVDPKSLDFSLARAADWFDFGQALTVHKAQGSQWENGVVMDESDVFRNAKWNHLYTAITRFSERLILAR